MKKLLVIFVFTFGLTTYVSAQKADNNDMVLIEGFQTHEPKTHDDVSEKTTKRYVHYMEANPINYEKDYRKVKEIVTVDRDRYFVSEFKDGVIYLNSRLNRFPATKEVVILHHLAEINGMQVQNKTSPHVSHTRFNITEQNEEKFRRQLIRHNPYKYIVKKLKEKSPLKSKL